MGLSRSTFYDAPPVPITPSEVLVRISAICDEFECYGYRRVGAALRHQGVVVNSKKLRRLMRETTCSRSDGGDTWSRPIVTMADRSSRTWPKMSFPIARTRCGSRT